MTAAIPASARPVDPSSDAAPRSRRTTRARLAAGAIVVCTGLALVGTTRTPVGPAIVLAGWALLAYAVHREGRDPGA